MTINLVDPWKNRRAGKLRQIAARKLKAFGTRKNLRDRHQDYYYYYFCLFNC